MQHAFKVLKNTRKQLKSNNYKFLCNDVLKIFVNYYTFDNSSYHIGSKYF